MKNDPFLSYQASARMDECRHFESNWINAVNMCKLAADAANSSGELKGWKDWKVCSSEQIDFSCGTLRSLIKRICLPPGAEQASTTLQTHVQVAQAQVDKARKLSEDVNKKLAETKVEEIQRMAEYAAFLDDNEEPELHEAYLREDWDTLKLECQTFLSPLQWNAKSLLSLWHHKKVNI